MKAVLFSATSNAQASREFYENTLGLTFVADQHHALIFKIEDITLRIQKVDRVVNVPYTTFGLEVNDINLSVHNLKTKGIVFENYAFLEQDDNGIWATPDGAMVAWFKDPDENLLSLSQASAL